MLEVKNVKYNNQTKESIDFIRQTVFIEEQGISADIEFDGKDTESIHAIISQDGKAFGVGRILKDGHIGRIAILKEHRAKGFGSKIVLSLIEEAKNKSYNRVYLGSQKHALDFYTKLGFKAFDDEYIVAGISHQSMELILKK